MDPEGGAAGDGAGGGARDGMGHGLVTTTFVADATPASFAAHVRSRYQAREIFRQMTELPVHVILGGGRRLFEVARERDGADLWAALEDRYTFVESADDLRSASEGDAETLLGLFAPVEMPPATERSPTLAQMTEAALRVLGRDPDGFFLMVGERGVRHLRSREPASRGDRSRDAGPRRGPRRGPRVPGAEPGTLVVVAADHETGASTCRGTWSSRPAPSPSAVDGLQVRCHLAYGSSDPAVRRGSGRPAVRRAQAQRRGLAESCSIWFADRRQPT